MKIFDCFMYFDEDLVLDLRLNYLDKYVDKFIIIESKYNHRGQEKKAQFDINKFPKFEKKIKYLFLNEEPDGIEEVIENDGEGEKSRKLILNAAKRENFQRNCIDKMLDEASENDWIIVSDLDEIPNLENKELKQTDCQLVFFKQHMIYYKFNLILENFPWIGSRACKKKYLKSPQWLRNLKFKKRPFWRLDKYRLNSIIEKGGWHFCNLKKPEDLLYKYKNMAETKDDFFAKDGVDGKIDSKYLSVAQIEDSIKEGRNLVGKKEYFKKIEIDNTFPEYILKNIEKYRDWIS